jgi:DNA-binding response OmpR family regulator
VKRKKALDYGADGFIPKPFSKRTIELILSNLQIINEQLMSGRILVIDDDKDMCLVLSKFLTKNGYEVDVAHTGDSGLKLLRDTEYILILCDYRLPDITGVEALQKIKVLSPTSACNYYYGLFRCTHGC